MTPSERRLHPLSFLFAVGAQVKNLLLPGIAVFFVARSATWEIWLMLLVIPYLIASVVRYLGFTYRVSDEELVIRTGLIFRNERHIPFHRIHNLGSVQGILHRVFNVVELGVETAGGAEPEARIQVLSMAAADELREHILKEKRRVNPGAHGVAAERSSPALLHLSAKELLLFGLVNDRGMIVFAAAAGFAWELGWLGSGWSIDTDPLWDTFRSLRTAFPLLGGAIAVVLGFLFFLVCLRLLSIGWALVKLHDFTLSRTGNDLTITRGLFTRLRTSIPLHRIQVVTVTERLYHRILDRAEMRVDTAGGDPDKEDGGVGHQRVAPIIRKDKVPGLLSEILHGVDLDNVEWQPIEPRAWKRLVKIYFLIALGIIVSAVSIGGPEWLLLALVLVPGAVINSKLHVRHMGWGVTDEMVLYRSGWLRRNISIVRHGKIQALRLSESPFDRRAAMAGLDVDTAGAGSSSHRVDIPYLDAGVARLLYDRLAASAADTTFRW